MNSITLYQRVHYTLRIAVAMCFIGHGAFGIITKAVWCNYFGVFGIGETTAYQLMPVVGAVDILMGLVMLFYPLRAIPLWLVIWGIITALLRPLSGEPSAEFVERAGNYFAPFAFLVLAATPKNFTGWFTPVKATAQLDEKTIRNLAICLRVAAFLLLLGHGWLNVIGKKALLGQYAAIGFANPMQVAQIVGVLEITAAFVILVKPFRSLILILFLWKMGSEIFYPHYKLFEWVERGGSYGVLLALWFIIESKIAFKSSTSNYNIDVPK